VSTNRQLNNKQLSNNRQLLSRKVKAKKNSRQKSINSGKSPVRQLINKLTDLIQALVTMEMKLTVKMSQLPTDMNTNDTAFTEDSVATESIYIQTVASIDLGPRVYPPTVSTEQEFDVLWLGGSSKAATLGRAQDLWLATGSKEMQGFNDVWSCDAHMNYATLQFKKPPERKNPNNVVLSFSDCTMSDGVAFDDLVPSLMEWAKYREGHGSTSGMWVLFPAYGGGGEEFDFKFVASWQNLEEQGADYDQYNESGWKKGEELFGGKVDCDSSRVYLTTNRRMAEASDD